MITAASAEAVVIEDAATEVWLSCTEIVPGATSKGVVADVSTPENATIEPTAAVVPMPKANAKLVPSVPSTTLYKSAP
jgi:hypothetical protein